MSDLLSELRALRTKHGYGEFDFAVKKLMRERLQVEGRAKRIKFPKSYYQKLFDFQMGLCPHCGKVLTIPATKNEIDHKNPNEGEHFNDRFNLQLLHKSCNREKSSKSILQQSKETGRMSVELLGDEI